MRAGRHKGFPGFVYFVRKMMTVSLRAGLKATYRDFHPSRRLSLFRSTKFACAFQPPHLGDIWLLREHSVISPLTAKQYKMERSGRFDTPFPDW